MKKTNYTWLLSELPSLTEAGVIDEPTADNIQNHYNSKLRQSNQSARRALFIITGTVFLFCVAFVLISLSWPTLPTTIKMIVAFAPLVTSALWHYYRPSLLSTLSWCISGALALALTKTSANIPSSISLFYWQWALLCTPVALLMKHPVSHTAALGLLLIGTTITSPISAISDFAFWPLALALVIQAPQLITGNEHNFQKITLAWALPIAVALIVLTTHSSVATVFWPISATVIFSAIYTAAMGNPALPGRCSTPTQWVGRLGLIGLGAIASHAPFWDRINTQFHNLPERALSLSVAPNALYIISTLLFCALLGYQLIRIIKGNAWRQTPLLFLALAIVISSTIALSAINAAALVSGGILCLILTTQIGWSIKQKHTGTFNLAAIALLTLTLTHFTTNAIPLGLKGALVIVLLGALLAINGWKYRFWRQQNA
ncbi:MAG: DUF2157 domain-containing protein [bacterium]|nr:DUF2157 domain-containing protein [bacterium]